jgi:hypothetical protein
MGNCYNYEDSDKDIFSDASPLEGNNSRKKLTKIDSNIDLKENLNNLIINNNNNLNVIEIQNNDFNSLSKIKLKLTIKQSKNLPEGKEYIINSFGLQDSKNNNKDGIIIFGDNNVS